MLEKRSKKKRQLNSYIRYSSLTTHMVVIIILGAFFGDYLDGKNDSETPTYTVFFSLASVFISIYYVLKKITNNND